MRPWHSHRKLLLEDSLELPGTYGKCLLNAEHLRELLEKVRGFTLREIEPGIDGPQFDPLFGALRIDERRERMLAEDGSHRPWHDRLAPIERGAFPGKHAFAEVAIALRLQEQLDAGLSDGQQSLERSTLEFIEATALLNGLTNESRQVFSQIYENIGLAKVERRCDDHTTASMLVVGDTHSMSQRPFFV